MPDNYLSVKEAAARLGISVTSLYDWLGLSDRGLFILRGLAVTIDYLQGGARGQGRIRIPSREVDRLNELMRVVPRQARSRGIPVPKPKYQYINVPLGHGEE